jgi:hypothetical protein
MLALRPQARVARVQGSQASTAAVFKASRRPIVVRAEQGGAEPEAGSTAAANTTQAAPAAPQQQQQQLPAAAAAPATRAPLAEGQGTAIVTGGISLIFGLAYFALVYVMDMRGGEMLPPPPEAFLP